MGNVQETPVVASSNLVLHSPLLQDVSRASTLPPDEVTRAASTSSSHAGPSSTPSTASLNYNPQGPANERTRTSQKEQYWAEDYRAKEEEEISRKAAARFAARLAADHLAVLNPDVDSPFVDAVDVVKRLLPYHIFQHPKEDLETLLRTRVWSSKGKTKAPVDDLQEEVAEARFGLQCLRRQRALQDRMRRMKIKSAKRVAPSDQAYILARAALESERAEYAAVQAALQVARGEAARIQREKHPTLAPSSRPVTFLAHPTAVPPTPAQAQYYRNYIFTYTQSYGAAAAAAPQVVPNTMRTHPTTVVPATSTTHGGGGAASGVSLPLTAYTPPSGSIPVQLPVASLSALASLGINPIPAAAVPPPDQPQPSAVLQGTTGNGTTLILHINVSLLHPGQMSGLASLLNSLIRSNRPGVVPTPGQVQPAR